MISLYGVERVTAAAAAGDSDDDDDDDDVLTSDSSSSSVVSCRQVADYWSCTLLALIAVGFRNDLRMK